MFNKEEKELFDLYYKEFKDVFKYYIDFLIKFESLRLKSYKCQAGIPTIGIGTTIYSNGEKVKMGDTITIEKAMEECAHYIYDNILIKFSNDFWNLFNVNQKTALISLIYNIGITNFNNSTLLKMIYAFSTKLQANKELINKSWRQWNKITLNGKKIISNGLSKRREEEIIKFWS